jgi:hypothetical protein
MLSQNKSLSLIKKEDTFCGTSNYRLWPDVSVVVSLGSQTVRGKKIPVTGQIHQRKFFRRNGYPVHKYEVLSHLREQMQVRRMIGVSLLV